MSAVDAGMLSRFGSVSVSEPLRNHTTYRIGGPADFFVETGSMDQLKALVSMLNETDTPWMVLGNGSNILASDAPYHGVVIQLCKDFYTCEFNENILEAYAGCSLIALSHEAMKRSLSGLEFASGIPGTLGGGVYMNAGAYRSDLSAVIESVTVLDENGVRELNADELDFTYRHSIFQKHKDWVILKAKLRLQPKDRDEIKNLMDSRKQRRLASQPVSRPSAGSVFRNPPDASAWKIVDDLGYRGKRFGGAKVSEIHSNFIINEEGKASARDVDYLIRSIQRDAKEAFGVELITEVERINWDVQEQSEQETEPGSRTEIERSDLKGENLSDQTA